MLGAAVWLPLAFATETLSGAGAWHCNALLFGTTPAILAGFLLTALPRWTKQPGVSRFTLRLLAATWMAARTSSFLSAATGSPLLPSGCSGWLSEAICCGANDRGWAASRYQIQNSRNQPEPTTLIPADTASTAITLRTVARV